MHFFKYHALGNDYIVLRPGDPLDRRPPGHDQIVRMCHRNFGIGADGILWGPSPSSCATFALRIFNPDGSEAEKSGNGLRIFARFLWDQCLVEQAPFSIETQGGIVQATVSDGGKSVTVEMGKARFDSTSIPVAGPPREMIAQPIVVEDQTFSFCAATIGNPHCVIPLSSISPQLARRYGPLIETHPLFPKRTNVQFMQVLDSENIRLEIWERGAGYTLASGSSSSAAAAIAHRLGLVGPSVNVHMPGGTLAIVIGPDYAIRMSGPVVRIASGEFAPEALGWTEGLKPA